MKALICGGRDFNDYNFLAATLDAAVLYGRIDITEIIHGGGRGADKLAARWAREQDLPQRVFPADWDRYGRGAGPRRNQQMLDAGKPDIVIAFSGGRGTADMVRRARIAGIKVEVIE